MSAPPPPFPPVPGSRRRRTSAAERLAGLGIAVLAAGLSGAPIALGQSAQPSPPVTRPPAARPSLARPPAVPTIRTWKLPNGLTVAHVERPGLPMVTVQVWYRIGSKDDPKGRRGAARIFERLLFEGSDRVRPGQHRRTIEQVGGQTSALTTEDVTAFHDTVPLEYLDVALELEAERMRHVMVRADAVQAARAVLVDDLRKQEQSPLYRAYERLVATVFRGGPYAWPPAGARGELDKLAPDLVKALYDAYYVPNNALVVVVGGPPAESVDRAVERWFGSIARGSDPPRVAVPVAGTIDPQRQVMGESAIGVIMAGWRLPEATHDDVLALQVAGMILTAGPSSRLHRRLVDAKLGDEIGGQVLVRQRAGLLVAFVRFAGGQAAPVEKALLAEVGRLGTQGPTAAELRRAKGQILGSAWFGMEGATGLANQIGVSWALTGQPGQFLTDLALVEKVTAAAVKKAAATYLAPARAALVVAEPSTTRMGGGR